MGGVAVANVVGSRDDAKINARSAFSPRPPSRRRGRLRRSRLLPQRVAISVVMVGRGGGEGGACDLGVLLFLCGWNSRWRGGWPLLLILIVSFPAGAHREGGSNNTDTT